MAFSTSDIKMNVEMNEPRRRKTFRFSPKRWIQLKFLLYLISVVMAQGSYDTLLSLQSSINIEKGIGVASATAVYVTAAIYGLIFAPMFLRAFGAKAALIFSQIALFIYMCANFYPIFYTMVPAGVIAGLSQATIWPAMFVYSIHFARRYAKYSGKGRNAHNAEFIGCQMCVHKLFLMCGNLFSYGGLSYGRGQSPSNNGTIERDLSHCGANDCQDANVTNSNLEQYVPASKTSTYIVLGVLASMIALGTISHIFLLDRIDPDLEEKDENKKSKNKDEEESLDEKKSDSLKMELRSLNGVSNPDDDESEDDVSEDTEVVSNEVSAGFKFVKRTLKATGRYLIQPKQLLIMPFALFSGLYPAFVYSELTRAFASCVFGVAQVGICAALFNFVHAITNLVTGRLVSKYGRNKPLFLTVLATLGNFTAMLLWVPTLATSWAVYCLFVLTAISESIWRITITELHASFFPGQQEIAYSVWTVCFTSGFAIQFGWSTSLCVSEKIYIQIGFVCFGSLFYILAQIREMRRLKKETSSRN